MQDRNPQKRPSLFVWRNKYTLQSLEDELLGNCIYCNSLLIEKTLNEYNGDEAAIHKEYEKVCMNCGWNFWHMYGGGMRFWEEEVSISGLYEFSIDDPRLAIDELGSFLKNNFSNIYEISSRKFEYLIADVFKNFGYKVILTPASRDDGVDVYVFGKNDSDLTIVECKKYSLQNKVGVTYVDRLIGVSIVKGARHACLITTSSFTKPALIHSTSSNLDKFGIRLDLFEAEDVLNLLNVYNNKVLPPFTKEIQQRWKELC